MIRFGIVADVHLGCTTHGRIDPTTNLSSRTVEFLGVLQHCIAEAIFNEADFFVIAGDLFDNRNPNLETIRAARDLLHTYSIPIWVLAGNHDLPGISGRASPIEMLAGRNVQVFRSMWGASFLKVPFILVPYPLRDQYMTVEEVRGHTQREVEATVVQRCLDQIRTLNPAFVIGHFAIKDAIVGPDQRGVVQEYEFDPDDLEGLGVPVIAGHVHYSQQLRPHVWYVGSPVVPAFGEDYTPSYALVDFDPKEESKVVFAPIPENLYRKPTTVPLTLESVSDTTLDEITATCKQFPIVRFDISCSPEVRTQLFDKGLVRALRSAEAAQLNWKLSDLFVSTTESKEEAILEPLQLVEEYLKGKPHRERLLAASREVMED